MARTTSTVWVYPEWRSVSWPLLRSLSPTPSTAQHAHPSMFDGRGEIARRGVAVHFHQASHRNLQIRLLDPNEDSRGLVLKERDLIFRRTIGDDSPEMNRVLPSGLLEPKSAYLGHIGEQVRPLGRTRRQRGQPERRQCRQGCPDPERIRKWVCTALLKLIGTESSSR